MSDDPHGGSSEPRLVAAIRGEIEAASEGRITFARFMQRALTEPDLGYYATSGLRPTRSGDFLTAPELHPLFGRCLGRLVTAAWATAGSPVPYRVREFGGGRGTLRDTTMQRLDLDIEWSLADMPGRSDAASGPVHLAIANEFLDALPVHRLLQDDGLHEVYVGWVDDWFADVVGEPSTEALAERLARDGVRLADGQRAEVCLAAPRWLAGTAAMLSPGGVLLVIDYGLDAAELYGPRHFAGSLLTYRDHAVSDDPYAAVGSTDITAHVDITALERAAGEAGLELVGTTTQGQLLSRLGLGELLAELGRQPDLEPQAYIEARSAVARLLDPQHLGAFRVMAWARPHVDGRTPALPGFSDHA